MYIAWHTWRAWSLGATEKTFLWSSRLFGGINFLSTASSSITPLVIASCLAFICAVHVTVNHSPHSKWSQTHSGEESVSSTYSSEMCCLSNQTLIPCILDSTLPPVTVVCVAASGTRKWSASAPLVSGDCHLVPGVILWCPQCLWRKKSILLVLRDAGKATPLLSVWIRCKFRKLIPYWNDLHTSQLEYKCFQ